MCFYGLSQPLISLCLIHCVVMGTTTVVRTGSQLWIQQFDACQPPAMISGIIAQVPATLTIKQFLIKTGKRGKH